LNTISVFRVTAVGSLEELFLGIPSFPCAAPVSLRLAAPLLAALSAKL
jgi:hypothetical protein